VEAEGPATAATVLSLTVQPETGKRFLGLFTEGVTLPIMTGSTLQATVCGQLGVSEAYFETRIQTIFLNFKAVDAPDEVRVEDGAIIALSAAMPGLVGATMRRGGTYAAMRSAISATETAGDIASQRGFITLKLFNMVARELGPSLLAGGVYLQWEQMTAFFKSRPADVAAGCMEIVLNSTPISWAQLVDTELSRQRVFFKVNAGKAS